MKKLSLVLSGLLATTGSALAAVPADVTSAITDGVADGKTIAYALLAFAVAVGVVMYLKRRAG